MARLGRFVAAAKLKGQRKRSLLLVGGAFVKLVARRGTAARATFRVADIAGAVPGVSRRPHVFANGIEITPSAGVARGERGNREGARW